MTSKLYYKSILSKIIPVALSLIFLMGGIFLIFVDKMPMNIIINYAGVSFSIILLIEIIVSFFITLQILHKYQIRDKKRAKLYLVYIPYFPALFVNLIFSFFLIMYKNQNYKYLIVFVSAIISTVNFCFSVILNKKLNIYHVISEEENK